MEKPKSKPVLVTLPEDDIRWMEDHGFSKSGLIRNLIKERRKHPVDISGDNNVEASI